MQDWDLFDSEGNRKYLTAEERQAFFAAITPALPGSKGRIKRTFALMLYYTGCRISEGLGVTARSIDYSRKGVVLKTGKQRGDTVKYRFVPLPDRFLEKLDDVHHVKDVVKKKPDKRLWGFGRTTGWSAIKAVMAKAGITGAQAVPHGLRHGFVIAHQQIKTPPHMIKEWAGWVTTEMLEVYARAMGAEERELARGIWGEHEGK